MVGGSGAGHVQQSASLGVAHLLVDGLVAGEHAVVTLAGEHPGVVRPHDARGLRAPRTGGQAGDHRDGELEPLGGVHGHDAHGVEIVLGQDRVGDPALRGLELRPLQVATDAVAAGVGPRPGLLDHVAQAPPHVPGVRAGEGEVERPSLVGDRGEQIGRRRPTDALGDGADVGDRGGDGMVDHRGRRCRPGIPGSTARTPRPQLDVAAPVERTAQRGHHRQRVGGIIGGPQRQQQVADLGGGVHDRGVLGAVGDPGRPQLRLEGGQGDARREQDADVTGPAGTQGAELVVVDRPSVTEGGGDGDGDVRGLPPSELVGGADVVDALVRDEVVVPVDAEQGDGAVVEGVGPPGRVQGSVGGLGVGFEGDQAAEHVVGELDDGAGRTEVGRQRHRLGADLVGRSQVLGDVGAPEPVDRLLGIADDEEPAGQRPQAAPGRHRVVRVGSLRGIVGVGRQPNGDLELDRVGVLELVEEHPLVAFVEQASDGGPFGDEPPREDEQVVELELPRSRALSGQLEHEAPEERTEQEPAVAAHALERLPRRRAELDLECLQTHQPLGPIGPERRRPLRLGAGEPLAPGPVAEPPVDLGEHLESGPQPVGRCEPLGEPSDLGGELGLGVVAGHRRGRDPLGERDERAGVEPHRPGIGELDTVVDEVPVGAEVLRHAAGARGDPEAVELAQLDQGATAVDRPARRVGVVEEAVQQVVPLLLERECALELVEDGEARWQAGLDREVEQDPAGEGVQRADRGVIESVERGRGEVGPVSLQARPGPAAQLGGGLLGEGDRGDGRDRHAGAHEADDAGHEGAGLARAGTGFDEQRGVEVVADPLPDTLVGWRWRRAGCHRSASTVPNQGARRGS
jgi:hypothetical protein